MAVTLISTIKTWFKTGLIPTQEQFWAVFDSYRHKSEKIPLADVEGINELIQPFNAHANDPNAHASLFAKTKIYAVGQLQVFKTSSIGNNGIAEPGDLVFGIVAGVLILGVYLGGSMDTLEHFIIISEYEIPIIPI